MGRFSRFAGRHVLGSDDRRHPDLKTGGRAFSPDRHDPADLCRCHFADGVCPVRQYLVQSDGNTLGQPGLSDRDRLLFQFSGLVLAARVYLASRLGVLSFLTPVFGVIFGVLLLNETVDVRFIAGALCTLSGIVLVSAWDMVKRFFNKKPAIVINRGNEIKR